jgi:hypothetical protein
LLIRLFQQTTRCGLSTTQSMGVPDGRSARRSRFAAWQNRPSGAGLTVPASVGVNRPPVSRLFSGGGSPTAVRVLLADAGPDRLRACFGALRVSRGSEVAAIGTAARHGRGLAFSPRRAESAQTTSYCVRLKQPDKHMPVRHDDVIARGLLHFNRTFRTVELRGGPGIID